MNIKKKIFTDFTDLIQSVTIALAVAIIVFVFFVTPSEVQGSSMEPTFHTGERLYTNKIPHWLAGTKLGDFLGINYQRGEIVVVEIPPSKEALIKRIIALPGEKIKVQDGFFYINGNRLEEPYLDDSMLTFEGVFLKEGEEKQIPENSYFVAGDNRLVSSDSRNLGLVKNEGILGKPFVRIWPINKFSWIQ